MWGRRGLGVGEAEGGLQECPVPGAGGKPSSSQAQGGPWKTVSCQAGPLGLSRGSSTQPVPRHPGSFTGSG